MTEYGRGRAPEPWHPEDPLYGDQGWNGHPAQQGPMPYAGGPQEQYAQAPQHQDPQFQDPQQYEQQQGRQQQQHPDQLQQQYRQVPQEGYLPHQQYDEPQQQPQPAYGGGPWDTGQGGYAGAPAPVDPYAGAEPYAQQTGGGFPGEAPDLYGTPEAFPPPVPPSRRHLEPVPGSQDTDVLAEDPEEESELPAGDDDGRPGGGGRRAGRSKKAKPRRRGVSCLVAAVVVTAVLGGGGYYGYTFIKERYGPGEDYAGSGLEETVDVEIPKGATLGQMGSILEKAGVVASAKAFVSAANTPKGKGIQPGTYPLKKKMSAAAAVALMTDPSKLNVLTIAEGSRNVQIYDAIDKKLGLQEGTTKSVAGKEFKNLGLPDWANTNKDIKDPLEGFLYPARYDLTKDMKPDALLKQMVARANEEYTKSDVKGQAAKLGLKSPLELVTVASLVQAEGKYPHDFVKISRVVYNRLKPGNTETYGLLDFDSTVNYMKGQSTLDIGSVNDLRKIDDPYNTYRIKGLPAGPIGNPGAESLRAAINPEPGPWYYFVSVNENKTLYAVTNEEQNRNRAEYEKERQKTGQ